MKWIEILHAIVFFTYLIGGFIGLWYWNVYGEEIDEYFNDLFDFENMLAI